MPQSESQKILLRELATTRGALRLARDVIQKQASGERVDVQGAVAIIDRAIVEARQTVADVEECCR